MVNAPENEMMLAVASKEQDSNDTSSSSTTSPTDAVSTAERFSIGNVTLRSTQETENAQMDMEDKDDATKETTASSSAGAAIACQSLISTEDSSTGSPTIITSSGNGTKRPYEDMGNQGLGNCERRSSRSKSSFASIVATRDNAIHLGTHHQFTTILSKSSASTINKQCSTREDSDSSFEQDGQIIEQQKKQEVLRRRNARVSKCFDKWFGQLIAFKAKHGHCNVSNSRKGQYVSLGAWCTQMKNSYKLIQEGKTPRRHLSQDQIRRFIALGFDLSKKSKTFENWLAELTAYKTKYGHCNVSQSRTSQYRPLGAWCTRMKCVHRRTQEGMTQKRALSQSQIGRLDALGFEWGQNFVLFEEWFAQLTAFRSAHGHCNVSTQAGQYEPLVNWCKDIKENYWLIQEGKTPSCPLPQVQIHRLDALGFEWSKKVRTFDEWLAELTAFKAEHGHCDASTESGQYEPLANWCKDMKGSYKRIREGKTPSCPLSKDQIIRLDALDFKWRKKVRTFEEWLAELTIFKAKYGHCDASTQSGQYIGLGIWCGHIRGSYKQIQEGKTPSRRLTQDQISILDTMDFEWSKKSKTFEEWLTELTAYIAEHGHCNILQSETGPYKPLGAWCSHMRGSYKQIQEGKTPSRLLTQDQISRLDALDFEWNKKVNTFEEWLAQLTAFKAEHGHCSVSRFRTGQYVSLGVWCGHMRGSYKQIQEGNTPSCPLSHDQISRLDTLDFEWSKNIYRFEEWVTELTAFKAQHGHCRVWRSWTGQYSSLKHWCREIRSAYKQIQEGKTLTRLLSKSQISRLDALGFEWSKKFNTFEEWFSELTVFKAKHGHCESSIRLGQCQSLGNWCVRMKSSYWLIQKGRTPLYPLAHDQIRRLDALGFEWSKKVNIFEEWIAELTTFKMKHGHCSVSQFQLFKYKPLIKWCETMKDGYKLIQEGKTPNCPISHDQIRRLDVLGFEWSKKVNTFEEWFAELTTFKSRFGHCNAAHSVSGHYKPLGYWCNHVRNSFRLIQEGKAPQSLLSKDQIRKLDTLGFQWDRQRTFEERLTELTMFKDKFGHCNVPRIVSHEFYSLGRWCSNVRYVHTMPQKKAPKHLLSQDQMRRLKTSGYECNFNKLQKGKMLSQDQIRRLDLLGFEWNSSG
jgi:hypothetical protein